MYDNINLSMFYILQGRILRPNGRSHSRPHTSDHGPNLQKRRQMWRGQQRTRHLEYALHVLRYVAMRHSNLRDNHC